jgi:large subunit ribosomal protein L13
LKKNPIGLVEKAVKGMLPKNRLGSALFRNLHVYAGSEHPHEAQKPKKIEL